MYVSNKKILWKPISREEYFSLHSDQMTVFSQYTDVTGHSYHWSNGTPKLWTIWGIDEPVLKWEKIGEGEF